MSSVLSWISRKCRHPGGAVAEADGVGADSKSSARNDRLNALLERIFSHDEASAFFRQGYIQGARDVAKTKPANLSTVDSGPFDLGYELGRLARQKASRATTR